MNAVERFEAMLASGKDTPLLRFSLGLQYLNAGQAAKAVDHLQAAVAADAGYSAAWKLLGRSLAETGRRGEAIAAYRSGIETATAKGDKQAAKEMTVFLRRLEKDAAPGAG